jgi:hypothetical protein
MERTTGFSFPLPGIALGAAADLEVGGDAQVALLPVGFHPRDLILLYETNGVAAGQPAQRRCIEADDMADGGRRLNRTRYNNATDFPFPMLMIW